MYIIITSNFCIALFSVYTKIIPLCRFRHFHLISHSHSDRERVKLKLMLVQGDAGCSCDVFLVCTLLQKQKKKKKKTAPLYRRLFEKERAPHGNMML